MRHLFCELVASTHLATHLASGYRTGPKEGPYPGLQWVGELIGLFLKEQLTFSTHLGTAWPTHWLAVQSDCQAAGSPTVEPVDN
jgi:hypothetical protein